ncbi:hypothetical protein ACFLZ8_00875 [Planctomycetota bacterium]
MILELEERGNIHVDTVWYEIVDIQYCPSDENNTIATIQGLTEKHYKLGLLFTAAPDLLEACQKQQVALKKLLEICSPTNEDVNFVKSLVNDAIVCTVKAIAKVNNKR